MSTHYCYCYHPEQDEECLSCFYIREAELLASKTSSKEEDINLEEDELPF